MSEKTKPKVREAAKAKKDIRCIACGKPCKPYEENTDGTYAHDACLREQMIRPAGKGEFGGNLYG